MRRWAVAVGAGIGVSALGIAAVFACTALSSLNLSQATGAPGSQLTVTGSSFNSISGGATPVTLHWNSVTGPVLAQNIVPDASGAIGPVSVTVPSNLAPGYYTILATQTDKSGQVAWGTPARAAFQVTGIGAAGSNSPGVAQPAATSLTANGSGLGAGMIGLLVALGVGGLLLFGLGAATFVGSYRKVPSASRVRK